MYRYRGLYIAIDIYIDTVYRYIYIYVCCGFKISIYTETELMENVNFCLFAANKTEIGSLFSLFVKR